MSGAPDRRVTGLSTAARIAIEARVVSVLRARLAYGRLAPLHGSVRLTEDLRADSLDRVIIQMGIEEEFGVAIDDDEAAAFGTVGDLVDLAARKLAVRALVEGGDRG